MWYKQTNESGVMWWAKWVMQGCRVVKTQSHPPFPTAQEISNQNIEAAESLLTPEEIACLNFRPEWNGKDERRSEDRRRSDRRAKKEGDPCEPPLVESSSH